MIFWTHNVWAIIEELKQWYERINQKDIAKDPPEIITEAPPPESATAAVLADPPIAAAPPEAPADPEPLDAGTPPIRCALMGDLAVADWLNCINMGSFFDFSNQYVLNHDECFVFFNSCQDISVWVEPYGFYSHYRSPLKNDHKMNFTLASFGSDLGAKFSLSDCVMLGAAAGYFHSDLKDRKDKKEAEINGIYFGPAVKVLFSEGSAQATVFGVKNYYDGPKPGPEESWDLNLRLEAEYDYSPPSQYCITDFMVHPLARIDYLNVFEQSPGRRSSFFYSQLGSRFDKVAYCGASTMITANLELGWVNMTPLSGGCVKCEGRFLDVRPQSKNQFALGLELAAMRNNGLLVGLEYDAALGSQAPMQTGRVRIEWNW